MEQLSKKGLSLIECVASYDLYAQEVAVSQHRHARCTDVFCAGFVFFALVKSRCCGMPFVSRISFVF